MTHDTSLRTIFDDVAKLYDEVRPGYPEPLIEDVIALSGIGPGGGILEIGCGPGKATIPFARRGYAMLCLELGRDLASLASENCRAYPDVRVVNISFEDWPLRSQAFDLVISAQAFHWISPEVGFSKTAAALKDGGSLALFWNHKPAPKTPFFDALAEVYRQKAPELADSPDRRSPEELIERIVNHIDRSGSFGEVVVRRYPWSERYTTEAYLKLLNTYSDHLNLEEGRRRDLFESVGALIDEFGGVVERPYLAVLYFAKVARERRVFSAS